MKQASIKDMKVPVQVVLGETELTVREIAEIMPGTILALTNLAGEPVDLVAAGQKIAKCEVVVIDEMFGIRVTSLSGQED